MEKFTYSIIIPHRDSLELLKRAVESIPCRNDIEIIIVDNSVENLDFSEIHLLNKNIVLYYSEPSRGAGGARNVGLDKANGKWVIFLDADDFFTQDAFIAFDCYRNKEFDIIFFKWVSCYSDTLEIADRDLFYNAHLDSFLKENSKEKEDKIRYLLDTPCGKMVSMNLIRQHNIMFDECSACNDAFFSTKTGYYAKRIMVCEKKVYCATIQKGSITNTMSANNLESRLLANLRISVFLKEHNVKVVRPCLKFVWMSKRYGLITFVRFIRYLFLYSYNPYDDIIDSIKKYRKQKINIDKKYLVEG